jgi:hypothetical protein
MEEKEYCKLKKEVLDRILWRTSFGKGCGPVVRQTTELINLCLLLRQNQKFNSAEGRFIRELQFDKSFEESGRGLLEAQYWILSGKNEEDHDSTRKDSRVLVRDSNPTTSE